MKYAFYPGCVAQGACPELYVATLEICSILGIELDTEVMKGASCTGSGILQEKNERLGDTLNARTFAMAENSGMPMMTICSTCQGVMSQANSRLNEDSDYLKQVNEDISPEGLTYSGTADPRHLLWILLEDIGIDKIKSLVKVPLDGMKIAPFYGCYIVRPSKVLGFDDHPDRQQALEELISAVGAEVVDFPGKTLCCGFPITTINETASMKMVARHTTDAQQLGADAMVTPCPLCHLNLDGFQPKAAQMNAVEINMPILHLPQMIGLALGVDPKILRINKHIMSTKKLISKVTLTP